MINEDKQVQRFLKVYKEKLPAIDPAWRDEVQQVAADMHEHLFEEQVTISRLKEKHHIHRKSFPVWFKRALVFYPREYLIHHRIEAGKLLLKEAEASVTEIALAVGFSSLSSFCNTFKNREGISPTQWRERNIRTETKLRINLRRFLRRA